MGTKIRTPHSIVCPMKRYKEVAIEAALAAGKFVRSRVGKITKISYKGQINLVTDIDRKSEALIAKRLKSNFPEIPILAEEAVGRGTREPLSCGYKWVVDPLDGTTNFAHGFPFFCVSIALEKKGSSILGIVYDPVREELFCAQKDKGAFLNARRIRVSKTSRLSKALLATGFAYGFKNAVDSNIENFISFMMASQAVRRAGSAALDLCYVACGRFDGFWELDLNPWDTAAAALIVTEAGGRVSRFSGKKFSHYHKEILASNSRVHSQMIGVLRNAKHIKLF